MESTDFNFTLSDQEESSDVVIVPVCAYESNRDHSDEEVEEYTKDCYKDCVFIPYDKVIVPLGNCVDDKNIYMNNEYSPKVHDVNNCENLILFVMPLIFF